MNYEALLKAQLTNLVMAKDLPPVPNEPRYHDEANTAGWDTYLVAWKARGKPMVVPNTPTEEDDKVAVFVESGYGYLIVVDKVTSTVHRGRDCLVLPTRAILCRDYYNTNKYIWS